MGGIRSIHLVGLIATAALLLGGAGTATAGVTITSNPTCCTFEAGPFVESLGENPIYSNPAGSDTAHNLTSTDPGPDDMPLFFSSTITAGNTSEVEGAQYLAAGTYPFYCTLHGPSMSGDLIVDGSQGTVVPRPGIKLAVPSQKLKKVRKTGKVKIKVKALAPSTRIALTLKVGKKTIGKAGLASLSGGSRTVTGKLTRAGKKTIRKGKKVKVSVQGTLPFGKPAKGSRTLR